MKIIISTRDNQYGIAKIVFREILQLLNDKNVSKVYYIGPKIQISNHKLVSIDINIIGKYYVTKELFYAFSVRKIIDQIIKRESIDLIYLHNMIYAEDWKVKTIFKCHGLHSQMLDIPTFSPINIANYIFHFIYLNIFEKRTIKYSKNTYFVSKEALNFARSYYPKFKDKFRYWPNYIDSKIEDLDSGYPKKIDVLYIGRLDPYKGLLDLIEAVNLLKNVNLTIIGKGPLYDKILKLNNSKINLLGYIDNKKISHYYKDSSLFVLPSYRENLPATIIEAIQANCLVLATSVGDNKYLLESNQLVLPGNIQLLKNKITALLALSPEKRIDIIAKNKIKLNALKSLSDNKFRELISDE